MGNGKKDSYTSSTPPGKPVIRILKERDKDIQKKLKELLKGSN